MEAYLVFSQTGTIPSRLIKHFTGDPYNHVSFSYDLDTLYSFARKYKYSIYPGGFIEEHLDTGVFAMHPNANIAIARIDIDPEHIDRCLEKEQDSGYNYLGLVLDKFGFDYVTDKRYCSQFVNTLTQDYNQVCVTPGMLYEKHKKDVIWKGTITEFLNDSFTRPMLSL